MEHRKEATPAQDWETYSLGKSVAGADFTEMLSCEDSLVIHFMLSGGFYLPAGAIAEESCRVLKTPVKSPGQSAQLVTAPTLQRCLGSVPGSRAAVLLRCPKAGITCFWTSRAIEVNPDPSWETWRIHSILGWNASSLGFPPAPRHDNI